MKSNMPTYAVTVRRMVEETFEVRALSRDAAKVKVANKHGKELGVLGHDWTFAIVANKKDKAPNVNGNTEAAKVEE